MSPHPLCLMLVPWKLLRREEEVTEGGLSHLSDLQVSS